MSLELIEQPSGAGKVYRKDGDLVGQVTYDLQVYQSFIDASSKDGRATIPGLKEVDGCVTGLDNRVLWHDRVRLTLHLQDGRRLDFQLRDLEGTVVPNGGLYEAG